MKNFFSLTIWVMLAAACGVAAVGIWPAAKVAWQTSQGFGRSLAYQAAAAGNWASSSILQVNEKINDPVFIPPAVGKVVRADLLAMKLSLYEDGETVATYDIVAKGKPGSPWETPTGEYRILSREETHYSSIGGVYMPWSLQFFGNFFIHGRPYDETGKELPDGYSGGCIRLATADAEAVYNFVELGTAVSVYAGEETAQFSESYRLLSSDLPDLSSQAYAAVDLKTGEIITAKGLDEAYPIASLSKLLTALVSLEVIDQSAMITVSEQAVEAYGTQGNLEPGESLPAKELLYPLLLESSNDAAEALADHYGRAAFIKLLNDKAAALGLKTTYFDDPSGLSPKNVSTARDLARLVKHIYNSKRYVFDLTREKRHRYGRHQWLNNNKFIEAENYLGGKNGYIDEAGQTQIALFELPLSEFEKRPVALIILKSRDRYEDMGAFVRFISRQAVFGEEPKNPTWEYL